MIVLHPLKENVVDSINDPNGSLLFLLNDVHPQIQQELFASYANHCCLWFSGDGLRAYYWLSGYIDLIKERKVNPSAVMFYGYDFPKYANHMINIFTIQEEEKRLALNIEMKELNLSYITQRTEHKKNNCEYLFEIYKELKDVLEERNIPLLFK